jgi:hypothetical protein
VTADKPKSKMISIRVSGEDYRRIQSRCREQGVASVSEFVRTATASAMGVPEASPTPAAFGHELATLQRRVDLLDSRVNALVARAGNMPEQE